MFTHTPIYNNEHMYARKNIRPTHRCTYSGLHMSTDIQRHIIHRPKKIYTRTYIVLYMRVLRPMNAYTNRPSNTSTHTHKHIDLYVWMHVNGPTQACKNKLSHVYTHTHSQASYTCKHAHKHTHACLHSHIL